LDKKVKFTLILPKNEKITIDGFVKDGFYTDKNENKHDLNFENLTELKVCINAEIKFTFPLGESNLVEIKNYATGGSVVPRFEMSVDGVLFDVFAMGAKSDLETEVTCLIFKMEKEEVMNNELLLKEEFNVGDDFKFITSSFLISFFEILSSKKINVEHKVGTRGENCFIEIYGEMKNKQLIKKAFADFIRSPSVPPKEVKDPLSPDFYISNYCRQNISYYLMQVNRAIDYKNLTTFRGTKVDIQAEKFLESSLVK
jgi:hypothetical protein